MVHKISGKRWTREIHHLQANNNDITDVLDIANTLGHTI